MKKSYLLLTAALCVSLTSCFKDEPLNAEADIEQAFLTLDNPEDVFFNSGEATINVASTATEIVFRPKNTDVDLTAMAPQFKITEGATIQPESGSTQDFSGGKAVQYTVTSQDGQWKRVYTVKFTPYYKISHPEVTYSFENYQLKTNGKKQYYEWTEADENGEQQTYWGSGNYGFSIVSSAAADDYPTAPASDGVSGSCVKLTTCSTGTLGSMFGMPIAAGNIFSGEFKFVNIAQAVKNTLFGQPLALKPVKFTGYYKYKPGETMTGATVEGQTDKGDIYAVIYKRHYTTGDDGKEVEEKLNGSNVQTDASIVAIAKVPEIKVSDDWVYFDIPFEYTSEIDDDLLQQKGYNIAIVATSSTDGASFVGAVGSVLYIDEFKIIGEETEEYK